MCLFNKEKKILLEKIGQLEKELGIERSKLKCPSLIEGRARIKDSLYHYIPYVMCTEKGRVVELEKKVDGLEKDKVDLKILNSELRIKIVKLKACKIKKAISDK